MNSNDEAISVLLRLPSSTLIELGRALSDGTLRHGFSPQTLLSFAGDQAKQVDQAFRNLMTSGFGIATAGLLCQGLGRALAERDQNERNVQLVLSGPEVPGTPVVDTRTTVMSLFEEACEEVLISSYVFHDAAEFFKRLAAKHDENPAFRVIFLVDLSHRRGQSRLPISLVTPAFLSEFKAKHWPGKRAPQIWHDPRAFDDAESSKGVLHAKTVIVDRQTAFITSANFTGAAQTRNIEAGILVRQPRVTAQLYSYFSGLMETGELRRL
jgi:hypothetical protein